MSFPGKIHAQISININGAPPPFTGTPAGVEEASVSDSSSFSYLRQVLTPSCSTGDNTTLLTLSSSAAKQGR